MRTFFALLLLVIPTELLQAQVTVTLGSIMNMFITLMDRFVLVAIGIALIVFIWGLVRTLIGMSTGESDKAITEGKQRMIWGVVALFVIISIWGIVELLMTLSGTGGINNGNPPQI